MITVMRVLVFTLWGSILVGASQIKARPGEVPQYTAAAQLHGLSTYVERKGN